MFGAWILDFGLWDWDFGSLDLGVWRLGFEFIGIWNMEFVSWVAAGNQCHKSTRAKYKLSQVWDLRANFSGHGKNPYHAKLNEIWLKFFSSSFVMVQH